VIARGECPFPASPGFIALSDGAREIEAIGAGVTRFAVGDRVANSFRRRGSAASRVRPGSSTCSTSDGWFAEYRVVREQALVTLPAFPDMTSTVTHMLAAEGDLIAVRNRVTGTQHGPLGELSATGNRVDFTALQLFRVEDELIVEHREIFDETTLTRQLSG
jgi:predicted ester cyclase